MRTPLLILVAGELGFLLEGVASLHVARSAISTAVRNVPSTSRRGLLHQGFLFGSTLLAFDRPVLATTDWNEIRQPLQESKDVLQKLLDNWERAVVDCTYADVPRELLEQKNKEQLLEKASEFALFDKSVSVTSCKTVVTTVRQYLGKTGVGPMANIEADLKRMVMFALDSDSDLDVDTLVGTTEDLQRELTRADSLSYQARRDFSSMNNFDPDDTSKILSGESNLLSSKSSIQALVAKLTIILDQLPKA